MWTRCGLIVVACDVFVRISLTGVSGSRGWVPGSAGFVPESRDALAGLAGAVLGWPIVRADRVISSADRPAGLPVRTVQHACGELASSATHFCRWIGRLWSRQSGVCKV